MVLLVVFYLLGLVAIGVVALLLAKAVPLYFSTDSEMVHSVIIWGCIVATLWIFFGGLVVFTAITRGVAHG